MRKFLFSLEALLDLRRNQENLAYKALLEAQLILIKSLAFYEELEKEKEALEEAIKREQKITSDVLKLANQYEFFRILEERIESQKSLLLSARKEMDNRRQELAISIQKRKMIENLQEKKKGEWEYILEKQERVFFDELATIRFLRSVHK
jgi:flagellar protein FliJ